MWFENTVITGILLLMSWYVVNKVGLLRLGSKNKTSCKGCASGGCETTPAATTPGEKALPMR